MIDQRDVMNLTKVLELAAERAIINGNRLNDLGCRDINRGKFLFVIESVVNNVAINLGVPAKELIDMEMLRNL